MARRSGDAVPDLLNHDAVDGVTWTKLGDDFTDRPEYLAVSRSARLLLVEMFIWSNRLLTDGRVPVAALPRLSDEPDLAGAMDELVGGGLVDRDDDAYQLDWSDQLTAEHVKEGRAYNAEKQKRYRDRRDRHIRGDHTACDSRFCKAVVTGNATSNKTGHETPSRPVPSRPKVRDRDRGAGSGSADATPDLRHEGPPNRCRHGTVIRRTRRGLVETVVCSQCEPQDGEAG
jgi:hypothetical protein